MSDNHEITVVDDEPDLLRMLKIYLELTYFQMNPSDYSLLITDVRMPHMSGLELVQNVFRIRPDAKAMLMTAFDFGQIEPFIITVFRH